MNSHRIHVYKDRAGKWRWRILAPNGRKIGASTESYEKRKMALSNLLVSAGIQIQHPPSKGGLWRRVNNLDMHVRDYL